MSKDYNSKQKAEMKIEPRIHLVEARLFRP
jgi:hypothetical protein